MYPGTHQTGANLSQMLAILTALENRRHGGGGGGGGGRRRRRRRGGGGGPRRRARRFLSGDDDDYDGFGGDEVFDDFDDEVYDEYDEIVGASDEAEMAELLEDPDDDNDESTVEGIGRTLEGLEYQLVKIDRKLKEKKSEYNKLPMRRKRRRHKLSQDITRLSRRRTKIVNKIQAKRPKYDAKYEKKYNEPPAPHPPPGVVPPGTGVPGGFTFRPGAAPVAGAYPYVMAERPPGTGMRIAFRDDITGSKYTRITVTPGANLRTAAIAMTTTGVAFGRYRVRGVEYKLQAVKPFLSATGIEQEMLINVDFTRVQVAGNIDLQLQDLDASQAAMSTNGQLSVARTLTGVRQDSVLDKTNTATLAAIFRQEITTTATNVEAVFTAAVIVDTISDTAAQRGG